MTAPTNNRQCQGRRCQKSAEVRLSWPSSVPEDPDHERYLCRLHHELDFEGRVNVGSVNVEILTIEIPHDN